MMRFKGLAMNSELIVMLDLSRRGDVKKKVTEKTKANICLCCDGKATCRGLCARCYNAFKYVMRQRGSQREQANFESACIREGKILESHDKASKLGNIFSRIAKKIS
jgi:hypothetical protein